MNPETDHGYKFGPFRLDLKQRLLLRGQEMVPLTPKLFETLLALIENSGAVVTKDELMKRVWRDAIVEERSLSQNVFLLRKALEEDSNGRQYIATVPKVGYRFLADVERSENGSSLIIEKHDRLRILSTEEDLTCAGEADSSRAIARNAVAITSWLSGGTRKGRWAASVVLLLVIVTGASYFLSASGSNRPETPSEVRSIAILPFTPLAADPGEEYLGLGMADSLIGRLTHLRQVVVRPTSAIRKYIAPQQDARAAGREQRVDAVLEGSIQRSGERIRLSVQLISVRSGAPVWSYKCDELCKDIFAVQDSISQKVAEALASRLTGEEKQQITKHHTENTEAYQLYIKGRYFWNKRTEEGLKKALEYFNQAIETDPNYALAYVGVADSYTMLADYDWITPPEAALKAKGATTHALEIDDSLAEAHASLADIRRFFEWDWAGAEREYSRAIELNPNLPTAHQWYGEFLSAMGRHDEAVREMRRAEELDPLSLVVKSATGWVLYFARRYDDAIVQCQKVIEMDGGFSEVYSQLRRAYEQKGMYREAMDADEKLRRSRSKSTEDKVESRNPSSATAYWQTILKLTKQDLKNNEAVQVRLAEAYAQLGERDRALELLERAYEGHSCWMPFLKVHPNLDRLHLDAGFERLLERVGLKSTDTN
ncbi:MAG TPA: winged helix-turn-helix domain-containing protein [Blastocatellia bacterium]|nr:winged helix-turn-helix domain-containing protein [Blastocatellia bacterium]